MSLRRVLVATAFALLSIAVVAGAGLVWLTRAPRRTPAGQPALSRLDGPTLPAFREEFNARTGDTRIVVLLSPT